MAPKSDPPSPAARRGQRVTLAVFVLFATAFIVSSTWQIARQVFGYDQGGAPATTGCAGAGRAFEEEVDRALTHSAMAHDAESARDEYEDALGKGAAMKFVEIKCNTPTSSPADRDTYVAAIRLREAAGSAAERQAADLARLRRSLEARATK